MRDLMTSMLPPVAVLATHGTLAVLDHDEQTAANKRHSQRRKRIERGIEWYDIHFCPEMSTR
jgi:hypothetical protein